MLTYKAMYKFLDNAVHGEVLDFPGAISFGADLEEARGWSPARWWIWRKPTCCSASLCRCPTHLVRMKTLIWKSRFTFC